MNIEYVSCKISAICWLNDNLLKRSIDSTEQFWLCGTYSSNKNFISIYSKQDPSTEQQSAGISQMKNLRYFVPADVVSLTNYNERSSFVSLANDQILFVNYSRDSGFNLIHWLFNKTFDHHSSEILVNNVSELVSSGLDGRIVFFDINSKQVSKSPRLTSNSLHCLDKISEYEFICGTTSGHVKLFDKRTQNVELSLINEVSIITTIKRNTNIPHIVACGNDIGLLYLWDLRNSLHRPMQPISVHTAEINCLKYFESEPNTILTSSLDGQLIKWNISNDFEINSVEAVIDKKNTYPINCFDVHSNQVIFADDNEVLYLTTL